MLQGGWDVSQHAKTLPIFWGHGTADNVVNFATQGKEAIRILTSSLGIVKVQEPGPGIYIQEYSDMGHTIDTDREIPDIGGWLNEVLPAIT
jgi:hypothetical protein